VADCSALEKHQRVKAFGGSNPSPTAKNARMAELEDAMHLGCIIFYDVGVQVPLRVQRYIECPVGQVVKSLPFQGKISRSIRLRGTNNQSDFISSSPYLYEKETLHQVINKKETMC
jgi:hypothetical protein